MRANYVLLIFGLVIVADAARHQIFKPRVDSQYTFAILSDIHIGESHASTTNTMAAVEKINSLITERNIKFVFITGDLTSSSYYTQWPAAKKILNQLNVPYLPIIGNHDIWPYNSTWEAPAPNGDVLFAKTMADDLNNVTIGSSWFYNTDGPVWDPTYGVESYFQNFEIKIGRLVFYGLDWNSRRHALSVLGYKGSMPGGSLYDFPGGTFQWLQQRLKLLSSSPDQFNQVVFLQHQPFRTPWWGPSWLMTFTSEEKAKFRSMISNIMPVEKYWGVFAGHFHIWYNGTAFDEWPTFMQWETEATKTTSAFTLVTVKNDQIVDLEQNYGIEPPSSV
jgi:predicted phosphodiesterase